MSKADNGKIHGAIYRDGSCLFSVWAPKLKNVALKLLEPTERILAMTRQDDGFWSVEVDDITPGTRYLYGLDDDENRQRPDPASRCQPAGVHGPSAVVNPDAHVWTDDSWHGVPSEALIVYEVHIGAFTREGTFDAAIERLDDLADLGINALEIMPVAQCPGERNWGYDGVFPFAAQWSYGGVEGLKRLVDACHARGIAVILDVVYNHLGPEGNYIWDFAPYFTDRYKTNWGWAMNFDGPQSDGVREYFIKNALYWLDECRIDALRLDAIHAIHDETARPFLRELRDAVEDLAQATDRHKFLIAEMDANNPHIIRPPENGGLGLAGQWCDEFHHALHHLLTGEKQGYYKDFSGPEDMAKSLRQAYVYDGQYMPSRQRRHGTSPQERPAHQFTVFSQNHDHIGNRMLGDRLSTLVDFEALKLAAGTVLLSPYTPLLFMGEEYGEEAPFLYFVDHGDADLIKGVRQGRKREFKAFHHAKGDPPDAFELATLERSKLRWHKRSEGQHALLLEWHRELIRLRKTEFVFLTTPFFPHHLRKAEVVPGTRAIITTMLMAESGATIGFGLYNFSAEEVDVPIASGKWCCLADSAEAQWGGPGSRLEKTYTGDDIRALLAPWQFAFYGIDSS